jgi:3-oxoadipate enol-lactonase
VLAFDHRGHGRGIRSRKSFRLEQCADDVAALAEVLDLDRFVAVGYSMGGPVAQLLWRRHAPRVRGLVLAATAAHFSENRSERRDFIGLTGLAALARFTPRQIRDWLTEQLYLQRKTETWDAWAIKEASNHDWRMLLEAGGAIGGFSSLEWLGEIDVPVSVLITMRDAVVPVRRQMQLFERIPTATAFRIDGEHDAVVAPGSRFVGTLVRACESVVERS